MKESFLIGGNDLEEIIETKSKLLDKSLLIKAIIDNEKPIKIITRPSRFGKSFGMNMLDYFFNISHKEKNNLFHSLKIWNANCKDNSPCLMHQGTYPVIRLSFLYLSNTDNIEDFKEGFHYLISKVYSEHNAIFESRKKNNSWIPEDYKKILERGSDDKTLFQSLKNLSKCLSLEYKQKVIVLVDEFDYPIFGTLGKECHNEIIEFIQKILEPLVKDNPYLYQSIFTGVCPFSISKIFSDCNDYSVCSMLDNEFSQYFGVTENELRELFPEINEKEISKINNWCGHKVGEHYLYHPFFITNYYDSEIKVMDFHEDIYPTNAILKIFDYEHPDFLKTFYSDFEALFDQKSIKKSVKKDIMSSEINKHTDIIWSLLIHIGILSVKTSQKITDSEFDCELVISNQQAYKSFKACIENRFNLYEYTHHTSKCEI